MLEIILVFSFAVHLAAVNVAAAGPLFCVVLEWRAARGGDNSAARVARRLFVVSLIGLVVGIGAGAIMFAILWRTNPSYFSAVERVPSQRWWFAFGEIIFYLACMFVYCALGGPGRSRAWLRRLLAIFASTNLLYHFPPLFAMISLLSTRDELADVLLDRSQYVEFFHDGELLARVAHHWLAALSTTGIAIMLLAAPSGAKSASARAFHLGARAALAATTLQLPVGLWLLFGSPPAAQTQLLGGEGLGTIIFAAAIFAIVMLFVQLMTAALGDASRGTAIACAVLFSVVLVLMSSVLHRMRAAAAVESPRNPSATELTGSSLPADIDSKFA